MYGFSLSSHALRPIVYASNNGANVIRQTATSGARRQTGRACRAARAPADARRPGAETVHRARAIQHVPEAGTIFAGVALIFLRVSVLPEMLGYLLGTSLYLLYIVTPFAMGGVSSSAGAWGGNSQRAACTGRYWVAFFVWMGLATIFSSWIGGSLNRFRDYGVFTTCCCLFIVGGLATNWGDIRLIFYTHCRRLPEVNLLEALTLFMDVVNGRMQLWENGTISNSNDLASQLLLVLPFVLWVAIDPKRNIFIRVAMFAAIGYGLWVVVGTASRGALIGIIASFLFILWRASTCASARSAIFGAAILGVLVTVALPTITSNRLGTLFGEQNEEARQSADARDHLFRQSLTYTFQHPLFGVGPDQFFQLPIDRARGQTRDVTSHPQSLDPVFERKRCARLSLLCIGAGITGNFGACPARTRMAQERGNRDIANAAVSVTCWRWFGFLVSITLPSRMPIASRFL